MIPPSLLTAKQAAEYATVSLSLMYQWIEQRRIPHLRAGGKNKRGKILIDKEDLDRFLVTLKVSAKP